ncbi:MAG: replication-associated recombination protein A [Candidatus Omnitrophica bacterium]|nr:replication-associated recombination protein A [Candidatus Omnitrophota bacterium]
MDLFEQKEKRANIEPLAVRIRPRNLDEFAGQQHILGEGKLLRRALQADRLTSMILYGPPGTGKNTLAHIIANITKAHFVEINATASNVAEIRQAIEAARNRILLESRRTILFIDEIHRFNKAQQDVLMPDVESGNPVLIGATTHNPFFSINSPLLSRSIIFELRPLSEADLLSILRRALSDKELGLGKSKVHMHKDALEFIARVSDGDARRALNALEVGILTTKKDASGAIDFTLAAAEESIQKKAVVYDQDEDGHYDTASAFIKSMRGSDPDAALYWLAKMIYAGEDPRFIARRIVICAAEDVGNADPQAIVIANAALQVSEFVGLPEARIPLAQATVYIACAPKSNAAYMGIERAMQDVKEGRTMEVPDYLRDASYRGAEKLGHGEGYKYAHSYKDHYVKQKYTPKRHKYYVPTEMGFEKRIKDWLMRLDEGFCNSEGKKAEPGMEKVSAKIEKVRS